MSQSFTAIEYAVLSRLRTEGRGTVPAIAADLLLLLGAVEEALASLVSKGLTQKEGEVYWATPLAMEIPLVKVQKAPGAMPAPAPAAPAMADVANVFKQARERAQRERSGGGV